MLESEKIPKTFDKFPGIKYNDDNAEYESLKLKYRDKRIQKRIEPLSGRRAAEVVCVRLDGVKLIL